jgi:hypothetical protein
MWIEYLNNPFGLRVGDCVIRAISKALNQSWEKTYIDLCVQGFMLGDLPSSNAVWSSYLRNKAFKRHTIEDCPECYTVEDFCREHQKGTYVIGTGSHAVAVVDGNAFDAWNSLQECPVYYFEKGE